ncbi:MAG TPA: caspase family protein [Hyphomicrobiaceae bacterium]|nr:caspase family protein [Hyphomicrobiaceae bacterium]
MMRAHFRAFWMSGVACCWAMLVVCATPAEARRVALVMGNADYKIGALANPVNDAIAVAETFRKDLGFDQVILKKNLTFDGFRTALDELSRAATGAEMAVVYFAGHGLEVNGKNFLIPVDATLRRAGALELEAIPLNTVLNQLEGVRELKLVILDACRNNPFVLRGGKRSSGRGLARIEPEDSTLVVYAARDGTTADDGAGRQHSPFTQALLKHIATPNVEVRLVLGRVGDDVMATTNHLQQPHVYGTLGGHEHYLVHKLAAAAPVVPAAPVQVPAPAPAAPQLSEVERAWRTIKESTSLPVLQAFRQQYGAANALYDRLIAERIEALKAAEERTKLAAVPPAPQSAPPAAAAPPPLSTPVLARQLQAELRRVGCTDDTPDGIWGKRSSEALEKFVRHAKLSLSTDEPTASALDAVKGRSGRVCPLECGPGTVEKDGVCVTKAAPARPAPVKPAYHQPRQKRATPPRRAQREKPPAKVPMCWVIEGRSSTVAPCTDPRATMRAY